MLQLIAWRLVQAVPVIWGVATIVFVLTRLSGDPVQLMLPDVASDEQVQAMRVRLGFDQPLLVQYATFLGQVLQGDFGSSIRYHQPAMGLVLSRLPATILLTAVAMIVALVVALPAGILAALRPGSFIDRLVSSLTLIGYAVPPFWLGLILIIVFAVALRLVPPSGSGSWQQLILPAIALGLPLAALLARLTRRGLIDAMQRDFIRTARAKGLSESQVLRRHAFRHAAIPVITIIGLQVGALLGGAIITETVFSYPGVGQLLVQGIYQRDFAIVQAFVVVSAITILIVNLVVDIAYRQVDPRIGRSNR